MRTIGLLGGELPADTLAFVFNNPFALADWNGGIDAAAVNRGFPHFEWRRWGSLLFPQMGWCVCVGRLSVFAPDPNRCPKILQGIDYFEHLKFIVRARSTVWV